MCLLYRKEESLNHNSICEWNEKKTNFGQKFNNKNKGARENIASFSHKTKLILLIFQKSNLILFPV
jgi:hypothetical protein